SGCVGYQIWHLGSRTIATPGVHAKARANSGMLAAVPTARYLPSGCSLVAASRRANSGRWLDAQIRPQEMKNRWSAARPSIGGGGGLASRLFFYARQGVVRAPRGADDCPRPHAPVLGASGSLQIPS